MELLLISIELSFKSWINMHSKSKTKKVKSILEETNDKSKIDEMIERYKDINIEDRYK